MSIFKNIYFNTFISTSSFITSNHLYHHYKIYNKKYGLLLPYGLYSINTILLLNNIYDDIYSYNQNNTIKYKNTLYNTLLSSSFGMLSSKLNYKDYYYFLPSLSSILLVHYLTSNKNKLKKKINTTGLNIHIFTLFLHLLTKYISNDKLKNYTVKLHFISTLISTKLYANNSNIVKNIIYSLFNFTVFNLFV